MSFVVSLTLSVLPLSVLSSPGNLFMVDINIPQMDGRNEMDAVTSIKNMLNEFRTDIHTVFAMKAMDNQQIRLILDVEDMCHWPTLTSAISKKGYKMFVTSVEDCSDFAERLGVSVTYSPFSVFKESPLFVTAEREFVDTDVRGQAYLDEVKEHFKLDVNTSQIIDRRCYAALMDIPVRLFYIAVGTLDQGEKINAANNAEGTSIVNYQMFQSLNVYKETC